MATKKKPKRTPWTPFVAPTRPPPGTFDPALDQQERAAGRGLSDLMMDVERDTARSDNDFTTATGNVERQRGEGLADLMLSRSRGIQDFDRRYSRLAGAQTEAINAAGALGGGALAQAMKKRAANRAYDESRFLADNEQARTRLGEAATRDLGALGLSHQRAGEDRTTGLTRAQREGTFLGQDINESRMFQAKAAGWIPEEKPKGEGQQAGLHYRRIAAGAPGKLGDQFMLTTGRVLGRNEFLEKLKRYRAKAVAA